MEGVEKINHLAQGGSEMFWGRTLHLAGHPFESLEQKILKIPSHAVDREEGEIVDMNISGIVGIPDHGGIDAVEPVFGGDIR